MAADQDDELGRFAADVLRPFFGRRSDGDVLPLLAPVRERMTGRRGASAAIVAGLVADFASHRGDGDEAARWSERSMELAEESADPDALRAAASARSWVRFNEGRHWEAVLLARGVLELAQSSGSGLDVARAHTSLGVSLAEDDQRAAMQAFLDAAGAAAAIGARLLQMQALANAAEAAVDTGSWDVADRALDEIAEMSDTPSQELGRVFTAASLLAMRGDAPAGLSLIASLGSIAEITDSVQVQTWYLRAVATSELAAGDAASALRHAREAIALEPAGANAPRTRRGRASRQRAHYGTLSRSRRCWRRRPVCAGGGCSRYGEPGMRRRRRWHPRTTTRRSCRSSTCSRAGGGWTCRSTTPRRRPLAVW